jgi:hypothetical protein
MAAVRAMSGPQKRQLLAALGFNGYAGGGGATTAWIMMTISSTPTRRRLRATDPFDLTIMKDRFIRLLLGLLALTLAAAQEPDHVNLQTPGIDSAAERAAWRTAQQLDRVIIASHTLTSDANLAKGSSTFGADQTSAAQAIFDQAQAGPIRVIWDVAISCTGLRVRSNTHIEAKPGCGAILRNASNKPLLGNYNPTASTIQDENIMLEGGIWNGNGANQSHDTAGEGWMVGVRMMGVRNVTLRDLEIRSTATFGAHFANWERVVCENVFCDVYTGTYNHDGLHFNGPGQYLSVRNLTALVDDDALALNANDITSQNDGSGSVYGPYAGAGAITDVIVDGVTTLTTSRAGVRLLSSSARIDRVRISNLIGKVSSQQVIIDSYLAEAWRVGGAGYGNFGSIQIDGIEGVLTGAGYYQCLVYVESRVEQLRISRVNRADFSQALPTLKITSDARISQLVLDGWTSLPDDLGECGNAASQISNAGNIGSFQILNSNFARPDGAGAGYPVVNSGSIAQFQFAQSQSGGFAGIISNTGTITTDNSDNAVNTAIAGDWTLESGLGTFSRYNSELLRLTPPNGEAKVAYLTANDAFSGNVQISCIVSPLGDQVSHYLFARGASVAPWSGSTAYYGGFEDPNHLKIYKKTADGTSQKAALLSISPFPGTCRMIFSTKDNRENVDVKLYFQRISDGYWMDSSGVFVAPSATPPSVLSWLDTNAVISGNGKCGVMEFASGAGRVALFSEFRVTAAP